MNENIHYFMLAPCEYIYKHAHSHEIVCVYIHSRIQKKNYQSNRNIERDSDRNITHIHTGKNTAQYTHTHNIMS